MIIKRQEVRQEFFPILNPRVIDGDAIEATIELAFGAAIIKRIRLKGFWAPELKGRQPDAAIAARARLEDWLYGRDLFIRCPSERQDKFGRVIAELWSSEGLADPSVILGPYQMTELNHRIDLDWSRNQSKPNHYQALEPVTLDGKGDAGEPAD